VDDYYIITGASRGLGAALSKRLLVQKSHVYGLSRSNAFGESWRLFIMPPPGHLLTIIAIDPGMMDTSMQGAAREADFELSGYFRNQKEQGRLSR
jgi:NAD(P)-dependent dehydrogenase (short-subunit alcohol dehydrogenase family)